MTENSNLFLTTDRFTKCSVSSREIKVNKLSCYSCENCISVEFDNCLKANEVRLIRENGDSTDEIDDEPEEEYELKNLISRGCIFVVLADDQHDDYFLVKSWGKSQTLAESRTDKWGAYFDAGCEVIRGLYFEKKCVKSSCIEYKLLKGKTVLVPAVSVRYICSDLNISDGILQMPENVHLEILENLE